MNTARSGRVVAGRKLAAAAVLASAFVAIATNGAQAAPVRGPAVAGSAAGAGPAVPAATDPDAARAIHQAAAAARAVPGDSPVEQVDRGIALFMRTHPGYVAPRTTNGAALPAEVIAAAEASRTTGPVLAASGTVCTPNWVTINSPIVGRFVRPSNDGQSAAGSLVATGTSSQPWNNWFLLCRDDRWSPGDYGVYANLGARYVVFVGLWPGDPWVVPLATDTGIHGVENLVRFQQYDGNFQTLSSPMVGHWIITDSGPTHGLSATTDPLNAWGLFQVRPLPGSVPCDPAGPRC